MKWFEKIFGKNWAAYTFAACAAAVLYWLLTHLFFIPNIIDYLSPVIWGLFFAYIVNPLVNVCEKRIFVKLKSEKIRHILSVLLSLIIVVTIVILLCIAVVPPIVESATGIANNIDVYGDNLKLYINNLSKFAGKMNIDVSAVTSNAENLVQVIVSSVTENSTTIMESFFNVGTSIVNIIIGVVLAIYFLIDKTKLIAGINKIRKLIFSEEAYDKNNMFWKKCHTILTRFFMFDIVEGVIIGIINMIFMLIFRMPYVALISVIVGLTNLIPTLGPIIGVIIGAFILVLTSPISALIFIIFTIALQTFDASILKPNLFGDSFGVPSVWIFIAVVVGGKLAGIIGVLFAIPVVAICAYSLNEIIFPILEKKKEKTEEL